MYATYLRKYSCYTENIGWWVIFLFKESVLLKHLTCAIFLEKSYSKEYNFFSDCSAFQHKLFVQHFNQQPG